MSAYAVIGAGSGGKALAGFLKSQGHEVRLWTRNKSVVDAWNSQGKTLALKGALGASVVLDRVSDDIRLVIEGASIIFVVLPANAHRDIANLIAPFIKRDQIIVLNPGRTGGVIEFSQVLNSRGVKKNDLPFILETQSLLCACRSSDVGMVDILSFKKENVICGVQRSRWSEGREKLEAVYKNLRFASTTLETAFDNMGALLHPTPVILNTGWIESRDVFFGHYYQAISPSVASYIEKMDEERLQIADAFGVPVRSVKEWHEEVYGFKGKSLYETLQGNSGYASIDAPKTLKHRYLTEDIPTGLVPLSDLGKVSGVPTPNIDTMIHLGSAMLNLDFRKSGRNLSNLGLDGKDINEIKEVFLNGFK